MRKCAEKDPATLTPAPPGAAQGADGGGGGELATAGVAKDKRAGNGDGEAAVLKPQTML